jgi:siroheme synthase-like protein
VIAASLMIAYRLAGLPVLVVGGGYESASRVSNLLPTAAEIHLVAPEAEICDKLKPILAKAGDRVIRHDRHFRPEDMDLKEWAMVLSCFEPDEEDVERSTTRLIFAESKKRKIPVNCADVLDCCEFWFMSNFSAGPVQVGISTNGSAPGLSRRIKATLEGALELNTGEAVSRVGALREILKGKGIEQERRIRIMSRIQKDCSMDVLGNLTKRDLAMVAEMVEGGGKPVGVAGWIQKESEGAKAAGWGPTSAAATATISDYLASWFFPAPTLKPAAVTSTKPEHAVELAPEPATSAPATLPPAYTQPADLPVIDPPSPGPRLTLVGGGPGSPSLLTLAALSVLRSADLVISDRLIPSAVTSLVPSDKLLIAPLKSGSGGKSDEAQDSTDGLVLAALEEGKHVARLKVGDPFLYGRGGEELLHFRSLGYLVDVIPGISSVTAAPVLAGIPTTHRGAADQILVTTGRGEAGAMPDLPPYVEKRTLIVLMGLGRLKALCELCVERGYPKKTPVAVIEKAGHEEMRTVRGTVGTIVQEVEEMKPKVESPVTIVFGKVVDVLSEID